MCEGGQTDGQGPARGRSYGARSCAGSGRSGSARERGFHRVARGLGGEFPALLARANRGQVERDRRSRLRCREGLAGVSVEPDRQRVGEAARILSEGTVFVSPVFMLIVRISYPRSHPAMIRPLAEAAGALVGAVPVVGIYKQ